MDNALSRIIKEIRQVIGDDADEPRYIETIPKRGYRFIAEVTNAEAEVLTTNSGKAAPASGRQEERDRERLPVATDRSRKKGHLAQQWQMTAVGLVALKIG